MKLYSYWRSTTSFRVRAALNLKGFDYEIEPVDLTTGAQRSDVYLNLNPMGGVPALVLDDGTVLTQSLAIIDYLDATRSEPPMVPGDPVARARVLAAALVIATEIHPVNNSKVLGYLKDKLGHSQQEAVDWMKHWMVEGLGAFQSLIRDDTRYCFGDAAPDMADLCLAGQMINARRWGLDLTSLARLVEIDADVRALPAIDAAMPENQPDAD